MSFPVLTSIVAAQVLTAIYVLATRSEARGRAAAVAVSAAALLVLVGVSAAFDPSGSSRQFAELSWWRTAGSTGAEVAHLGVDGIAAVLMPVNALLCLAVLLAAPRPLMGRRHVAATLLTCSATLVLQSATDLETFVGAWILELLPAYLAFGEARDVGGERRARRLYGTLVVAATTPILVGAVLLHLWTHRTVSLDNLSLAHHAPDLSPERTRILLGLFMFSMFARKGLFPLHSWLPAMLADGPIGVVVQLLGGHASLMLLVRVVTPMLPGGGAAALSLLDAAGIFSAVYAALVAVAQRDLRSATGYVAMAQSSLIFVGAASGSEQSLAGSLLMSVGFSVSITGLALLVRSLRARIGTTDLGLLGGLVGRAPLMTAMFLVFTTTLCAIPGSIGFVAEDLLIHGVLHTHPWVAGLMLVAAALNAITLFRAFSDTFLGRPRLRPRTEGPAPIADLHPRERVAAFALSLVLLVGGMFPSLLLRFDGAELHAMITHGSDGH